MKKMKLIAAVLAIMMSISFAACTTETNDETPSGHVHQWGEWTVTEESTCVKKGEETRVYILNTNTHVFHVPSCSSVKRIKEENREEYQGIREKILEEGYTPCGICNP